MEGRVFKQSVLKVKFSTLMTFFFPGVTPFEIEKLQCKICEEFKQKNCEGENLKGEDVITDCLLKKADEFDIEFSLIQKSVIQ